MSGHDVERQDGDTLTFYAMVAQEGYVSRDGVLNGENSNDFPHRHLSQKPAAVAEGVPDACNSTAVVAEPDDYCLTAVPMVFPDVCSTCATEPAQERRVAFPTKNAGVVVGCQNAHAEEDCSNADPAQVCRGAYHDVAGEQIRENDDDAEAEHSDADGGNAVGGAPSHNRTDPSPNK